MLMILATQSLHYIVNSQNNVCWFPFENLLYHEYGTLVLFISTCIKNFLRHDDFILQLNTSILFLLIYLKSFCIDDKVSIFIVFLSCFNQMIKFNQSSYQRNYQNLRI